MLNRKEYGVGKCFNFYSDLYRKEQVCVVYELNINKKRCYYIDEFPYDPETLGEWKDASICDLYEEEEYETALAERLKNMVRHHENDDTPFYILKYGSEFWDCEHEEKAIWRARAKNTKVLKVVDDKGVSVINEVWNFNAALTYWREQDYDFEPTEFYHNKNIRIKDISDDCRLIQCCHWIDTQVSFWGWHILDEEWENGGEKAERKRVMF